jgi:APA family basic amino acid/polyamine antiporter
MGWSYIAIVAVATIGASGCFSAFFAGLGLDLTDWAVSTADEGRGGIINIPATAVCVPVFDTPNRATRQIF